MFKNSFIRLLIATSKDFATRSVAQGGQPRPVAEWGDRVIKVIGLFNSWARGGGRIYSVREEREAREEREVRPGAEASAKTGFTQPTPAEGGGHS